MRIIRRIGRYFVYALALIGGAVSVAIAALIVTAALYSETAPELPERIVLRLNLDHGVVDGRSDDPWRILRGESAHNLRDLVVALDAAGRDDRVVGLAVRIGGARVGLAHAQELRQALAAFRAKGKFTTAFAETFGVLGGATSEYYLASAFEEIWLQPSGVLGLTGIALETPHLKGAFDRFGIQAEFEQRHEYKSAVEMFTRTEMSQPSRRSLEKVLASLMRQILGGIASDRRLAPKELRALVDRAPLLGREARAAGLIDRLGYWDEYLDAVVARAGDDANFVDIADYMGKRKAPEKSGPGVALIYGTGPIERGAASNGPFGSKRFAAATVAKAITDAAARESIQAIILRIDSPGGSYIGSDTVRRAVKRAREKGKPVIASMGAYGASGGYFVAMGADKIVAQPGTLTGSIGVFGGKIATRRLWESLGVNWSRISVGANAGMTSPVFPFSPGAAARHRAVLDFIYRDFTEKAAADRGFGPDRLDAVARGRVWTGEDAHEVGLIDALGGLSTAIGLVREALKLSPDAPLDIVVLPKPKSPLDRLWKLIAKDVPLPGALAAVFAEARPDPYDAILRRLEPVIGDVRALLPPAGVVQLPPFRIVW